MPYRVVITETNIDETTHPQAFRYVVEADTEADAVAKGRARFTEQHAREPAPRAIVDVESLD
ncbi:MAG: hypothetical protein ABSF58_00645 [Solirubrobacteraceae bacterium]